MPQPLAALPALLLCCTLAFAPPLHAQDGPKREAPPSAAPHRTLLPADSTTEHEITIAGRKLAYSATAGTLVLRDGQGEATAEIFYVSFVVKQPADAPRRPVTYLFNGGPGASSAFLDVGAIGPRALAMRPDGTPPENARMGDNPDTWLPFTDLVFIDPVGTGWSRATDPDKGPKEFWGVQPDLEALADAIQLHLAKIDRRAAPIYLVGESYGGFRASRLALMLATDQGVELAGVVMISPVIEYGLMSSGPLSTLSWALRLPSYAAAHLGDKSLEPGALAEAEHFALYDYLTALSVGQLDDAAAAPIFHRLAEFTGLDEAQIAAWHGRISLEAYLKEVHRSDGRVMSGYDATVGLADPNPWSEGVGDDPAIDGSIAPFTAGFTAYAADELGYKTDQPFKLLSGEVNRRWDWGSGGGPVRTVGASGQLRRALALQPRLKVMIAHGVADLTTPYMTSRYIRDHTPDALRERIVLKLYAGGHMIYLHAQSRRQFHDDAAKFYGTGEN